MKLRLKNKKQRNWIITIVIPILAFLLLRKKETGATASNVGNTAGTTGQLLIPGLPRGLGNNNPLNLRISSSRWLGKVPISENTDGSFEQFKDGTYQGQPGLVMGYRAAIKNIIYHVNTGNDTISKLIHAWAPASDGNNPTSYAQKVASNTGNQTTTKVPINDPSKLWPIVREMAIIENGIAYKDKIRQSDFNKAYNLL
jgi:hypothetical protein